MNDEKLQSILNRFNELEAQLADPEVICDQNKANKIAKEKSELAELADLIKRYFIIKKNMAENVEMVETGDIELQELANQELTQLDSISLATSQ